jgi:hypothetical protein
MHVDAPTVVQARAVSDGRTRRLRLAAPPLDTREARMAIAWFVIWFVANLVGGDEALKLDPVNAWTATLILALALDINRPKGWMGPPPGRRGGPPWKRS